jgi:hypothetical protein
MNSVAWDFDAIPESQSPTQVPYKYKRKKN